MFNPEICIYKEAGQLKLEAHLFVPEGNRSSLPRPVVAFFHGGGWVDGSPLWGYPWCQHFYDRGLAAVSFGYRLANQTTVTPLQAVQDARSALRWVRANAARLGFDPHRVVATGFSAGGYLAACTAMLAGIDDPQDDLNFSARPDALVLVSTPLDVCQDAWFIELLDGRLPCYVLSPAEHICSGLPPSVLFHAGQDDMVSYSSVAAFVKQMQFAGNRCQLFSYPQENHFLGGPESATRRAILAQIDAFFVSLCYLTA